MNLITCKNLGKSYGQKKVLENVNLTIESGKIYGLLGTNGSGKTTLIKLINGLLVPTKGEIQIKGKRPGIESKKVISYLPERTYLPNEKKVKEVIAYFKDFYADFQEERALSLLQQLKIDTNSKLAELSKGTKEKVSCDLNYRNKLWSKEKAGQVMGELCKYVDVCIANEEDASDVFGIKAADTDVTTGSVNHQGYKAVAKQLAERFGFGKVAITLRESLSANDNNWSAMLYDGFDYFFSKKYKMHIVDRVGGGDSFGGGFIYAALNDYDSQEVIEFAVAASCMKHSIEGDFNLVSVDEVIKLAGGDGSGRVQR